MSDTSLRARGVSEIVDAAFALFRLNATQYITLGALAMAPSVLYSIFLTAGPPRTAFDMGSLLPGSLLSLLSYTLLSAVIVRMGSDVYLGVQPDIGATVRDVLKRLPALIGAILMTTIVAMIAFILLILPVFLVAAMLFATVPAIVIEKRGATNAMSRSAALSKGNKWRILGTLVLVYGIYFVLSIALSLGFTAIGNQLLQIVAMSAFGIVVGPILNLALMVLYYDTRIRNEGFDVQHMAESLSTPHTAPAAEGVLV